MFEFGNLQKLNDFFTPFSQRMGRCVYFVRVEGFTEDLPEGVKRFYQEARQNGVIIDGRIPNPTPENLAYFQEMLGSGFRRNKQFINEQLSRWLPRLSISQRENIVGTLDTVLEELSQQGKNDNMLHNAYVKYLCWMYFKFERILAALGQERLPKILYDGTVSAYELQMLTILAGAGADILMLVRDGKQYQKVDPVGRCTTRLPQTQATAFPDWFTLKWVQKELEKEWNRQRLYGTFPTIQGCTNAWMGSPSVREVLTAPPARGNDPQLFYNAFVMQHGVEDRLLFSNDLFSFYQELERSARGICLVNQAIPAPTPEEIASIRRQNYTTLEQMILGLSQNIVYPSQIELQRLMVKGFVDLLLEESQSAEASLLKLTNRAVYLLVWLKRYQQILFPAWKPQQVPVFILFGNCASQNEALFLRLLARLPVDVLVLIPNRSIVPVLEDRLLLRLNYEDSMTMEKFPTASSQRRVATAAYQAERDLDALMYQDSGMYRNQQYARAEAVTLQTMYEEIALLWDQEIKYRPSFSASGDKVTVPVLFEKVCGVKDGDVRQYWFEIKKLITPDTILVDQFPWISATDENPVKPFVTQFLKNGRLQRQKIQNHKAYPYTILRQEMQDFLLDQVQCLLDQKVIAGTYENGTEYTVLSTALNLPKSVLRMIQKFDFTKKNPKLLLINPTERILNLEESIVVALLNRMGFDVLLFIPTGFQCVEKFFSPNYIHEQQIGEYVYDLTVPNFATISSHQSSNNPLRKLFGRGLF